MKNIFTVICIAMMAACGTLPDICPGQKPCPQATPCPTVEPCPQATPCPDCPPMPPPCPEPPAPPEFNDVIHVASEFEITAVLAAPNTLGLYISDPNGSYSYGIFPMPELRQKLDYEQVLTLVNGTETTYDIGTTEGKEDPYGLVVSALCEREFAPICDAAIVTNGPNFKSLTVTMTEDPNIVFQWDAK